MAVIDFKDLGHRTYGGKYSIKNDGIVTELKLGRRIGNEFFLFTACT